MIKVITKDNLNRSIEANVYATTDFIAEFNGTSSPVKTGLDGKIDPSLLPTTNTFVGVIEPDETKVIDTIPVDDFISQEYTVTVQSENFSETKSFKLLAHRSGLAATLDSMYAIVGNASLEVTTEIFEDEFLFKIKNNTEETLSYSVDKVF